MNKEEKRWWESNQTVLMSPQDAFKRLFEAMKSQDLKGYWESSPVARDLTLEKMVRAIFK
jgi:hypothetical protein